MTFARVCSQVGNNGRIACRSAHVQRLPAGTRAAFTLIEMVIVIVILGVVSMAVVPALRRQLMTTNETSIEPVMHVLRASRQAAVDSGRTVRLFIDPVSNQFQAILDGASSELASGTFEGVQISTDSLRAVITFDPAGTAFGDSMTVSGGGQSYLVSADPWTGVPRARTW